MTGVPFFQEILFGRLLEFLESGITMRDCFVIFTIGLINLLIQHVFICHLWVVANLADIMDGIHVAAMVVLYQQTIQCKGGNKAFKNNPLVFRQEAIHDRFQVIGRKICSHRYSKRRTHTHPPYN